MEGSDNEHDKGVSALEAETGAHGVVVVCIYGGKSRETAIAAHRARGGIDPEGAEIAVFINKPGDRPDREIPPVVIRRSKDDDLAALIAERRASVARLNAQRDYI